MADNDLKKPEDQIVSKLGPGLQEGPKPAQPDNGGMSPMPQINATQTFSGQSAGGSTSPMTREVGDKELVSNQMDSLLKGGSSFIETARLRAQRASNARGGINSSMAAGAGQDAAIRNALPIAQQDAMTHAEQGKLNQNTINKFRENTQQFGFNSALSAQDASQQSALSAQQHKQTMVSNERQGEIDINKMVAEFGMRGDLSRQEHYQQLSQDEKKAVLDKSVASFESQLKIGEASHNQKLQAELDAIKMDHEMSLNMKQAMVGEMGRINAQTMQAIEGLNAAKMNIKAYQDGLDNILKQRDAMIDATKSLFKSSSDWVW